METALIGVLEFQADRARLLALDLLRTDSATNGGQQRVFLDDVQGFFVVAFGDSSDEIPYSYPHRAAFDARGIFALQAAQRFQPSLRFSVAQSHFVDIVTPIVVRPVRASAAAGLRTSRQASVCRPFFSQKALQEAVVFALRSPQNSRNPNI